MSVIFRQFGTNQMSKAHIRPKPYVRGELVEKRISLLEDEGIAKCLSLVKYSNL